MMRLLLFIACLFVLGGCCRGTRCDMDVHMFEIVYYGNYTAEEADTLMVYAYKSGSNFTELLATEAHRAINTTQPYSFLPNPRYDVDYVFALPGGTRADTVTDFTTRQAYCTSCDRYENGVTILTGFTHNGARVEGYLLHIKK